MSGLVAVQPQAAGPRPEQGAEPMDLSKGSPVLSSFEEERRAEAETSEGAATALQAGTLSPEGTAFEEAGPAAGSASPRAPGAEAEAEEEAGAEQAATALLSMFASPSQREPAPSGGARTKTQYWRAHRHGTNPRGYALILSRQNFPHRITLPLRSPGDVGAALFGADWIRGVRELPDDTSSKSKEATIVDGEREESVTYVLYHNTPGKPVYLSRLSGLFRRNKLVIGDVLAFWPLGPGRCGVAVFKQGSKEAQEISGAAEGSNQASDSAGPAASPLAAAGAAVAGQKRVRSPEPSGGRTWPSPGPAAVVPKRENQASPSPAPDGLAPGQAQGAPPGAAHVQAFIRDLEQRRLAMLAANTSSRQSRQQKSLQTAIVYNTALALQRQRQQQQQQQQMAALAQGAQPQPGAQQSAQPGAPNGAQQASPAPGPQAEAKTDPESKAGPASTGAVPAPPARAAPAPAPAAPAQRLPLPPEVQRQILALVFLQQKSQALLIALRDGRAELTPERSGALGACIETFSLLTTLMLKS